MMRRGDIASLALLLLAAVIVLWVRLLPLSLPIVPERATTLVRARIGARLAAERSGASSAGERQAAVDRWIAAHPDEFARDVAAERTRLTAALQYEDAAGRRRPFLGDYDSYTWLRAARNYLRSGTVCDAVIDGQCRDTFTLAPVGTALRYGRSLHTAAIVAVHRAATWLDPSYPLPASAYLVPVIVGVLGVLPAFAIGRRVAGPVGGFVAAVVSALHPIFLQRSMGGDDDVWNVVLPLYMVWAVIAGVQARRPLAQLACGALGGAVAGLHAATWRGWTFGYAVVLAGLGGAGALQALRWIVRRRSWRVWQAPPLRAIAVVALAYYAATAACTVAAGAEESALRLPLRLAAIGVPPAPADGASHGGEVSWPSALGLVGELTVPTLGAIAMRSYGYLLFFVGWLGMLLLLLPRHDWDVGHFAVLIGGTLLYRYLLTAAGLGRATLVALLVLPLAAAVLVDVRETARADVDDTAAGMVIAAWLLAALLMSYEAVRYLLLLAAPFGIAMGVAAGRLHLWLDRQALARFGKRSAVPRLLAAAAVLAAAILPIRASYAAAASYLPAIDRAWADTLANVRSTSPPDAIVNTWWDYGYWTKYLAERRVSADGGTLLTHTPHWLARAELAASESEAVGLLRMLNCGSDAPPYPEGAQGAYGKLTRYGLSPLGAYDAVVRLASLDRSAADGYLAGAGLDAAARTDVLTSTHCAPPASYLVLASEQVGFPGWWQIGRWDPRRGGVAQCIDGRGVGCGGFVTADWVACELVSGGNRRCAVGRPDNRGRQIDAVVYPSTDVHRARLVTTPAGGAQAEAPPDLLMVVEENGIETFGALSDSGTAVLVDPERHRALVGAPSALGSLYTRLMFLDGRDTARFRKVDEHTGAWGGRVVTWVVDW